jgi:hypothetical protein
MIEDIVRDLTALRERAEVLIASMLRRSDQRPLNDSSRPLLIIHDIGRERVINDSS